MWWLILLSFTQGQSGDNESPSRGDPVETVLVKHRSNTPDYFSDYDVDCEDPD